MIFSNVEVILLCENKCYEKKNIDIPTFVCGGRNRVQASSYIISHRCTVFLDVLFSVFI